MEKYDLLRAAVKYITGCDNVKNGIETKTISVNNYLTDVAYMNYDNILFIADFNDVQIASISQWYEDTISPFYDEKIKKYIILHYTSKKEIFCLEVFVTKKGKKSEYDVNSVSIKIDDLIQNTTNA